MYYFRGLSALRLGNQNNAADDFETGAGLETERGNSRSVSRALERIQGPIRMLLEESRTKARLLIAKRQGTASGSPGKQRAFSRPSILRNWWNNTPTEFTDTRKGAASGHGNSRTRDTIY